MQEYKSLFTDHYVEHVTNLSVSMGNTMEIWWTTSGWLLTTTGHGHTNQLTGDSLQLEHLSDLRPINAVHCSYWVFSRRVSSKVYCPHENMLELYLWPPWPGGEIEGDNCDNQLHKIVQSPQSGTSAWQSDILITINPIQRTGAAHPVGLISGLLTTSDNNIAN